MTDATADYICAPTHARTTINTRALLGWLAQAINERELTPLLKQNTTSYTLERKGGTIRLTLRLEDHASMAAVKKFATAISKALKEGYCDQLGIELSEVDIRLQKPEL